MYECSLFTPIDHSSPQNLTTLRLIYHLCLDAGYDYDVIYSLLYEDGYEPHVRLNRHNHVWYWQALSQQAEIEEAPNALETTKVPRRWVVERTQSQCP